MRQIVPEQKALGDVGPDLVEALAASYAYPDRLWVRANMITSVDGAVSLDGRSGGLSGPADRLLFTVLRSLADVILVGAGTARAEQYGKARLSRLWPALRQSRPPAPPIAVITRKLDLDLDGRLMAEPHAEGPARTIVLTTQQAPVARREAAARTAHVIVAGADDVTAAAAIAALGNLGHRAILVEGGPMLLGQIAATGRLDELCLTISPILEGGRSGRITVAPGSGAGAPAAMALAALCEDDGFLLARYRRSGLDAEASPRPQPFKRLRQDRGPVHVGAALLHVRQMRLVRLYMRRRWRAVRVATGRHTAARAIPQVGNLGVVSKTGHRHMAIATKERHSNSRGRLAPLRLTHGPGADAAAADRVTTAHCWPLPRSDSPALTSGAGRARRCR